MKNSTFIIASVSIGILLFSLAAHLNLGREEKSIDSISQIVSENQVEILIRDYNPVIGDPEAEVVLVEWLDPECEACGAYYPKIKHLLSKYGAKVKLVVRYIGFHKSSVFAIMALEESREFSKYSQALDLLFSKQSEWGSHHHPRPELIPEYFATLGIPAAKLDRDYLEEKYEQRVENEHDDAESLEIEGTPTFFVNNRRLTATSFENLVDLIEYEIKQKSN